MLFQKPNRANYRMRRKGQPEALIAFLQFTEGSETDFAFAQYLRMKGCSIEQAAASVASLKSILVELQLAGPELVSKETYSAVLPSAGDY